MASNDFTVAMVAPCQLTHRQDPTMPSLPPCTPCTLFDSTLHRHLCSSYKADAGDSGAETARPVRLAPNSTMSSWAISEAVGRPARGRPRQDPLPRRRETNDRGHPQRMHSVTSSSIGSIAGFICPDSFPGLPTWRSELRRCRKKLLKLGLA